MTPQKAISELHLRVNKIASSDYDNVPDWVAIAAINKFQLDWIRRQIIGLNRTQEGDEETKIKVDDLQLLLVPGGGNKFILDGKNHEDYFISEPFPSNYLYYKRVIPLATSQCCENVPLESMFVEEGNIPSYLNDWSMQPSFDWRHTLHTLMGNRIRVYREKDFLISGIDFVYYRKPQLVDIHGYKHEDGRESVNSDIEFKDDIANIIIDGAALIVASDIESPNATQILTQRTDTNT